MLSCGFVIPVPPFISCGGGGQIAICSICSWAAQGPAAAPGSAARFGAGEEREGAGGSWALPEA